FKKYVAPQVVEEIAKKGGYHIRLGGENRNIAVLFVDIRGFTPMSESLEPEQVVDILNSYLNLTTNSIFANGGTLDKFIGDATMAVFNAPFDLDDYVYRAVKTAWDIVSGGNAIESKFLERYGKSVSFGVGVNCGPAVVGNIGCDFRMDYTAIGDTVNTAARLEANAKRGQVLISESVYEQVKDRVTVEPIGEIPLKGKSKGVFVYSLTGIGEAEKEHENEQISDNSASE
ncbi:MAG: adenylate/guanylate cyclase domain-containing protein, partial [Oscillospiraceae bacterium]